MIATSRKINKQQNLPSFTFKLSNTDGGVKDIFEPLLTTEESAKRRAIAEFLNGGLDKQEVEFETYFADLKINDVVALYVPKKRIPKDLTKNRFIIKEITHIFNNGFLKTKIKAERYD